MATDSTYKLNVIKMWVFYIYMPEKLDLLYTHMIRLNLPCVLNMEGQSKYSLHVIK